jgi:hypothetical protein
MVSARSSEPVGPLVLDAQPPWTVEDRVPDQILQQMQTLALSPLSLPQWQRLSAVRRFALLKLSRPGHDNDNFVPALREFELLTS